MDEENVEKKGGLWNHEMENGKGVYEPYYP